MHTAVTYKLLYHYVSAQRVAKVTRGVKKYFSTKRKFSIDAVGRRPSISGPRRRGERKEGESLTINITRNNNKPSQPVSHLRQKAELISIAVVGGEGWGVGGGKRVGFGTWRRGGSSHCGGRCGGARGEWRDFINDGRLFVTSAATNGPFMVTAARKRQFCDTRVRARARATLPASPVVPCRYKSHGRLLCALAEFNPSPGPCQPPPQPPPPPPPLPSSPPPPPPPPSLSKLLHNGLHGCVSGRDSKIPRKRWTEKKRPPVPVNEAKTAATS